MIPIGQILVDRRLAFGACLPTLVDPHPLIRIFTDNFLDLSRVPSSRVDDIVFAVVCDSWLEQRSVDEFILFPSLIPDTECRIDQGVRPYREQSGPAGGAGRPAKEWHKNTFFGMSVDI